MEPVEVALGVLVFIVITGRATEAVAAAVLEEMPVELLAEELVEKEVPAMAVVPAALFCSALVDPADMYVFL